MSVFSKKRKTDEVEPSVEKKHLSWTSVQGHCLTGGGRAEELYSADRGFSFLDSDCPHFHLLRGDTHEVFQKWRTAKPPATLVTGAWNRPLFCGGWHHTTDQDERVYNVQTHNMFVDLRIPKTRELVLGLDSSKSITTINDLNPHQLRLYARQHVFAGFSVPSEEGGKALCTRHHCIDWNFVGHGRPRPNKWWIHRSDDLSQWKESSYATDERGQYYYFERWERWSDATSPRWKTEPPIEPRLALRKSAENSRDGVLVIVGDHFNYVHGRQLSGVEKDYGQTSLVNLVDAAVEADDLDTAKAYLSIEAGHGTVSSGWRLDCAIPPWKEGTKFWDPTTIEFVRISITDWKLKWQGECWDVVDCSFQTLDDLESFFKS